MQHITFKFTLKYLFQISNTSYFVFILITHEGEDLFCPHVERSKMMHCEH